MLVMRTLKITIALLCAFAAGWGANDFWQWGQSEYWSTITATERVDLSEQDIALWNSELASRMESHKHIKCLVAPLGGGKYVLHYFNLSSVRSVPASVIHDGAKASQDFLLELASKHSPKQ